MSDGYDGQPATPTASDAGDAGSATAISIRGVSKHYEIFKNRSGLLAEALLGRRAADVKHVLSDINLEIARGEVVGVIGKNGAGKSTLLKLIAGTLQPSAGKISVEGRVSAILELGTGFNPAYSGRDNVVMSGLMRGLSEAEIKAKLPSIIAFSGLEDVIDQPFQTYSSGMQARLAFAAAVAADADVIIIDEALAAGDIRFTARSLRRVREICESGVTALFVSHQTYHVIQLCTRAIWIDEGRVRMDGAPIEVCRAYEYEMHEAIARDEGRMRSARQAALVAPSPQSAVSTASSGESVPAPSAAPVAARGGGESGHFSTGEYRILSVDFLDEDGRPAQIFRFGRPMTLRVAYERLMEGEPEFSCGLAAAVTSLADRQAVMYLNTNYPHSDEEIAAYFEAPFRRYKGRRGVIEARIPYMQLRPGEYLVSLGILPNSPEIHQFYEYRHLAYQIAVSRNGHPEPAVFYAMVEWTHRGSAASDAARSGDR